jgi:hypothetical protein
MTQGIRLAICIPVYGDTKAKFTLSLAKAIDHFRTCRISDSDGEELAKEIDVQMVSCSMLTESRHRLVGEALAWGATHLLWLDADHVFPEDAIPRLLSHNVDVVGANYPRRVTPTAPTACKLIPTEDGSDTKNLIYTTPEKAMAGELEEAAHIGFGVCLMNMRVLDLLQVHADEHSDGNFMPLFEMKATLGKVGMIGEDVFFFKKVREAGGQIFVDHALSWEVGHITDQILTNAHAVAHQERWIKKGNELKAKYQGLVDEAEAALTTTEAA